MRNKIDSIIKNSIAFWSRFYGRFHKPFVYVAIGDSTVEGVGATSQEVSFAGLVYQFLRSRLGSVEFYNYGKIHARVQDVIDMQLPKAIEKNPDLIVLSVGANDIRHRTSERTFEKNYSELVNTLKSQTKATIIINNIPDISILNVFSTPVRIYCKWWVARFNRRIAKHTNNIGAVLVDVYLGSKQILGLETLVAEDGIHPSDAGHKLWAQGIIEQMIQNSSLAL